MSGEQLYFYTASVDDIYTKHVQLLPPFDNHPIQFISTPEDAMGKFFALGYILDSDKGLFTDNGKRYIHEAFNTTDGSNSTEDDVPNRLSILLNESPYNGIPVNDLRFGVLLVNRYIQPTFQQGGSRYWGRRGRGRGRGRGSRDTRGTRRNRRNRRTLSKRKP